MHISLEVRNFNEEMTLRVLPHRETGFQRCANAAIESYQALAKTPIFGSLKMIFRPTAVVVLREVASVLFLVLVVIKAPHSYSQHML